MRRSAYSLCTVVLVTAIFACGTEPSNTSLKDQDGGMPKDTGSRPKDAAVGDSNPMTTKDGGGEDSAAFDGGTNDRSLEDSGAPDSNGEDSAIRDTEGAEDTGRDASATVDSATDPEDGGQEVGVDASAEDASGIDAAPDAGFDAGACPAPSDACETCLSNMCFDLYCDCYSSSACTDLIACVTGCQGVASCIQGCWTQNPNGISSAFLAGDCAEVSCASACQGLGTALPPCNHCLHTHCPAEMNTCLANPQCASLAQCLGSCVAGDVLCQQQCFGSFPGGATDVQPVISCAGQNCTAVCPI